MRKLGGEIRTAAVRMAGNSPEARINLRAHEVRTRFKKALEAVYRERAELFLAHVNNVYIFKKDQISTLIVYVDDSLFAADLNAQRELIRLKLLELFGEDVAAFEIHVSRWGYREKHPYLDAPGVENSANTGASYASIPLDDDEKRTVFETGGVIRDEELRKAFEKAMTADLESKKGKRVENRVENENRAF